MKNKIIKEAMWKHHKRQWQVADMLGISEQTLCRMMRYDLPEEEQQKIASVIEGESENNG